jgi:hypothetical protein
MREADCPACKGERLRPSSLAVKVNKHSISEVCNMSIAEIKRIQVDLSQKPGDGNKDKSKKSKEKEKQPPKKRVITQTDAWTFRDFTYETQLAILDQLHEDPAAEMSHELAVILQQIQAKRQGYKQQDAEKGLFDAARFIDTRQIIELLHVCRLCCFYCKEPAQLVYETVRDPKQWSLERIDNTHGHNAGNVEIACLSCNVRRRTIYHERYIATKQMAHIVKLNH